MELLSVKAYICNTYGIVTNPENWILLKINPNLVDAIDQEGKIYLNIDNERVLKLDSGKYALSLQGFYYTDLCLSEH